jgi:hypothetical protein
MNPTNPVDFVSRFTGLVVVLSVLAFAWQFAKGRGASFINNTAGSLTGGILSTDDDSGPWDGV